MYDDDSWLRIPRGRGISARAYNNETEGMAR